MSSTYHAIFHEITNSVNKKELDLEKYNLFSLELWQLNILLDMIPLSVSKIIINAKARKQEIANFLSYNRMTAEELAKLFYNNLKNNQMLIENTSKKGCNDETFLSFNESFERLKVDNAYLPGYNASSDISSSEVLSPKQTFFTPAKKVGTGAAVVGVALAGAGSAAGVSFATGTSLMGFHAALTATAMTIAGATISTGGLALMIGLAVLGAIGVGLMIKGIYDQHKENEKSQEQNIFGNI